MSKFYVGQRVRIVGCVNAIQKRLQHHVGKEGRIISACAVHLNCWDVDCAVTNSVGAPCSWHADHLEPLTDPGREVVSWETCEWKPEHLREVTA